MCDNRARLLTATRVIAANQTQMQQYCTKNYSIYLSSNICIHVKLRIDW